MSDPLRDGDSIDAGSVGVAVFGALTAAFFDGIADIVRAVYESFILTPLDVIADHQTEAVEKLIGIPGQATDAAFASAASFSAEWGVFGYAMAVTIALATAYVLAVGWSYV